MYNSDTKELYHPVSEEDAKQFVNATADSEASDDDRQQQVERLLQTAAENNSWRQSRDPAERMEFSTVPFATAPQEETPQDTVPATTQPENPNETPQEGTTNEGP